MNNIKKPVSKIESVVSGVKKIPVALYGWIIASVCILASLAIFFVAKDHMASSKMMVELSHQRAEELYNQRTYELQIQEASLKTLEEQQRYFLEVAGLYISSTAYANKINGDNLRLFVREIYNQTSIDPTIDVCIPLAFSERESNFSVIATNVNRHRDTGAYLGTDRGLFQFNGLYAETFYKMAGENYRSGIEAQDIPLSVRVFYTLYRDIRNTLEKVRPFEGYDNRSKEYEIKFVAYAYNRGLQNGVEAWAGFRGQNIDTYLKNLYSNTVNENANHSYPILIWNKYVEIKNHDLNFSFIGLLDD